MGRLKTRQERFCQRFVECANASAAARAAGYSPQSARNAGYRLLRHPRIAARIAAIQAETARAACRSADVLLGKLETVYRRSVEDHHFSTAARAVELQARISGLGGHTDLQSRPNDGNHSAPVPNAGAGQRRNGVPGNVVAHRPAPRPVNDN